MADKILLVFVFYRLYLNHDFLGFLFGFDGTNVGRLIKRIEPVLSKKFKLTSIKRLSPKLISNLEQLREICPDIDEIIGDATEQEIPRPKDKEKRKKYYSGKKKRHTVKTQIFIESCQILEVSPSTPGSIHDYKLFQMTKVGERLPRDKLCYLDKGYQGAKNDYPDLQFLIPKKSNRWYKPTKEDKIQNQILNKIRVKIEHPILKCKRFKILKQIYRHSLKDYHQRFQIIAGTINFQLRNKENLIPVSIPTFNQREMVLKKV